MKIIKSNEYLKNKTLAEKLLKQTVLSSEAVEHDTCVHWIELDDECGKLFEYCRKYKKNTVCCGNKERCIK